MRCHQFRSLPLDTIRRWFYLHPKLTNYLLKVLSVSWSNAMHIFIQSSQCPTCFGVGHYYPGKTTPLTKKHGCQKASILSCTHRYVSRPFRIELSMYSLNVQKFSFRLNVSVHAVLDQLADINLTDMYGTNNTVKYLLKSYLTVFLPSLYRSSKLTFFKRSPHGYFP